MRVLVVGAGIGGMVSALCLHRAGHHVTVIERAAKLEDVGAGIQISPNALAVLSAIGLQSRLLEFATQPDKLVMCDGITGDDIFSITANTNRSRWPAPYLNIHRADLISALSDDLHDQMPDALRLNTALVNVHETHDQIIAETANGESISADLLIGADGVHSNVRKQIFPNAEATFTGNVAWRATVPMHALGAAAPKRNATVWAGAGKHAVTYQLRSGTFANLVAVVEQPDWQEESWTVPGDKALIQAHFKDWHPTVTTLIDCADTHFQWALLDRPPLSQWHRGSVGLLGDACHPLLPFLAQGAAMAIEDAWVLAACLDDKQTLSASLARYEQARIPRVTRVYRGARRNEKIFHRQRGLLRRIGRFGLNTVSRQAPAVLASGLDWLYGYDATQAFPIPERGQQSRQRIMI
ncbi:MAG: FAD-dependent monooxygenase [Woeseiaceae bacterium]